MSLDLGVEAIVARRDSRCIGERVIAQWAGPRRQKYLLRINVDIPISIDPSVTPVAIVGDRDSDVVEIMGIAVAVTSYERELLDQWRPGSQPPSLDSEWRFLGYDVCDRVEKSALMNCAMSDGGKPDGYWRLLINGCHLFERLDDADQFRRLSNTRVAAHAPFVVMALLLHTQSVVTT